MIHASFFTGVGGFDLAAEWMGWENAFHCEWNPFGKQVLKYYWPNSISYANIKDTDFNIWNGRIDVLTGGFPCQPYSTAGKRLGKDDDRHLWPEMLRGIREIKPRWVVGENVRGLVSWNGGMVFDEVQTDLEAEGYEVLPFLLPACAVNAPHRRDRIWFVAYAGGINSSIPIQQRGQQQVKNADIDWENESWLTSNTSNQRLQGRQFNGTFDKEGQIGGQQPSGSAAQFYKISDWRNFPTQSPVCRGNDGLPTGLAGITVSKHRKESIKAYGNAVVPQVVYQIFKAIQQYETLHQTTPEIPE